MDKKTENINKPHRFLLMPKSNLSVYGQDIFAILLLKIMESYDKDWFGKFDLKKDDNSLNEAKEMIIKSLRCHFSLSTSDLMKITDLKKRDLVKKHMIDKRLKSQEVELLDQGWNFELDKASKELHRILLESYSKNNEGDWKRVTRPLLIDSSYDGKKLEFTLHKEIAFELLRLNYQGQGFVSTPKTLYFAIRNKYAKKILELISRFKSVTDYKVNLVDYYNNFDVDFLSLSTREKSREIEKCLIRAIAYLVNNSNGYVTYRADYPKGYELVNLGERGKIIESTMLYFRLDINSTLLLSDDNRTKAKKALDSYRLLETFSNDIRSYNESTLKLTDIECLVLFEEQYELAKNKLFLTPFMMSIIQPVLMSSLEK